MASISELKSSITFGGGLARNNQFLVTLPSLGAGIPALSSLGALGGAISGALAFLGQRDMNILCRTAQIPGKQVLTHERRIGMETQRVAYGYGVEDVTLSFMETSRSAGALHRYLTKRHFKIINALPCISKLSAAIRLWSLTL